MKKVITNYLTNGGNIFVSGAYVGSDMFIGKDKESDDYKFCKDVLKYRLASDHAVKNGVVEYENTKLGLLNKLEFNKEYSEDIYRVEAPDAIGSTNGSETFMRYTENFYSAGVAYKDAYGSIVIGFPFEAIKSEDSRNELMNAVLKYFKIK